MSYDDFAPYRLWQNSAPVSSHTDVDEAVEAAISLVVPLAKEWPLVVSPDWHSVTGAPLLQFLAPGRSRPLICVLYGAAMEDWLPHAHKLDVEIKKQNGE
jgi:hypothetical protein